MKKRTKLFGGIVILGIVGIAACSNGGTDTTNSTSSTGKATQQAVEKQEVKKITLADYDAIVIGDTLTGEGGATYDDLVAKFGKPSTESTSQSGDMKMIFVTWNKNISGDFGANMSVTFTEKDGQKRASSKSQYGMK